MRWVPVLLAASGVFAAGALAAQVTRPERGPPPRVVQPKPVGKKGGRPGEVITPAAKGERLPDRLKVGEAAPDFTLPLVTGKGEVTLSTWRGKQPVVLIFASYTRPPFRRQSGDLERLYQEYKDRAAFVLVYIREAHPDSVRYVPKDGK